MLKLIQKNVFRTSYGKWKSLYRCKCGKDFTALVDNVRAGRTVTCGCKGNLPHNEYGTSTYRSWSQMITRCYNKKSDRYPYYGGRGITVQESWRQFANFHADMGDRPKGFTLERVDVNGNYGPDNCVWASKKTQARNRRTTRWLVLDGVKKSAAEWAELQGYADAEVIYNRLKRGWSVEESIKTPVRKIRRSK